MGKALDTVAIALVFFLFSDVYGNDSNSGSGTKSCKCVPYYQCDLTGHIITDGTGLLDARKAPHEDDHRDPQCDNSIDVCCLPSRAGRPGDNPRKCGTANPNLSSFDSRILNKGRNGTTKFGEYPWQAALLRSRDGKKFFLAAGVLIDERHILTAAHKIGNIDINEISVRVGAWNLTSGDQLLKSHDIEIASMDIHPDYNADTLHNDIAVITLSKPVKYAENIENICLPDMDEKHDGYTCVSTGWGKDAFEHGKHSAVLKQVHLPIVNSVKCLSDLKKTRLGEYFILDESFICAGGEEGFDSCVGDGGGPLVCQRKDGTYTLMGIVSWGIDCGQKSVPGVYVNIPYFVKWITTATKIPLKSYQP